MVNLLLKKATMRQMVNAMLPHQAIKELVLRGYITPHCNKSGFNYSISKEGVSFCESLNDKYAEDFIEIVRKANVLFLDYSDRKLTHCINKYAIAMLRGEKS